MALRFQDIEIPLGVGVDTKNSEKVVRPGSLLRVENAVLSRPGEARKRNGYKKLPMTRADGTVVSNVTKVYSSGETLIAAANGRAEEYEEDSGRWRDVGSMGCFRVTRQRLLNPAAALNPSQNQYPMHELCGARGFAVHLRNDESLNSPDSFFYSVINVETGVAVVSEAEISGGIYKLGLCSYKDRYAVIVYYTSTEFRAAFIDMQNPTASPTLHTLASDIDPIGNRIKARRVIEVTATGKCVGYYEQNPPAPNTGRLVEFDENGVTGNAIAITGAATGDPCAIAADSDGYIYVIVTDGVEVVDPDWATLYGPTTASTDDMTLMIEQDGGSGVNIYTYEIDSDFGGIEEERYMQVQTVSNAAVIGSASVVLRGVVPNGVIFKRDGVTYMLVPMETDDGLQTSLFLIDGDGNVLSRINVNSAAISTVSTGEQLSSQAYIKDANTVYVFYRNSTDAIFSAKIDFSQMGNEAQLGGSQFIAASQLYEFDGTSLVESGFHHYPSKMAGSVAAAGVIPIGVYLYMSMYRWTDKAGNTHYSAPSAPLSYSVVTNTRKVTIEVTTLKLTQKANVEILLFRTVAAGSDFYFVASGNNDTTANKVDILDNLTDASLIANAAAYTAGGVLENLSPPSPTMVESYGSRLFAITDDNIIHYTKKIQEDRGVEFAGEFRLIFDQRGGRLSSMKGQEYQMVVTRERAIGRIQGAGPNDKGAGGEFTITDSIPSESGAALGSPMLETSFGTMFKSADKGIFLLDRSLQSVYAGAAVEAYNDKLISDTATHPTRNEVLFAHYTGEVLRLDTLQKQWVADTISVGGGLTSLAVLRGKVYASTAGGSVVRESDGFRDGSSYFPLVEETPWIHVSGLAGFQRVPLLYIVGTYISPHTLNVWIYYDNDVEPSEKIARVLSSDGGLVRIKPKRQKCTSMKLLIFDSDQSGSGESIRLNAVRLRIGLKPKAGNYRSKGS